MSYVSTGLPVVFFRLGRAMTACCDSRLTTSRHDKRDDWRVTLLRNRTSWKVYIFKNVGLLFALFSFSCAPVCDLFWVAMYMYPYRSTDVRSNRWRQSLYSANDDVPYNIQLKHRSHFNKYKQSKLKSVERSFNCYPTYPQYVTKVI